MEHNFAQRIIASAQVTAADNLTQNPEVLSLIRDLDKVFGKKASGPSPRAHINLWEWFVPSPEFNVRATLMVGFKKANYGEVTLMLDAYDSERKGAFSWDAGFSGMLPNPRPEMGATLKKWGPRAIKYGLSQDPNAKKRAEEMMQKLLRVLS